MVSSINPLQKKAVTTCGQNKSSIEKNQRQDDDNNVLPPVTVCSKQQGYCHRRPRLSVQSPTRPPQFLKPGDMAPDALLTTHDGTQVPLSHYLGHKVWLCFYRYVTCPACAYSIEKLLGKYKKLAWACKLQVITVFHSTVEAVREGISDESAPIVRSAQSHFVHGRPEYPFVAVADPTGQVGAQFQVRGGIGLKSRLQFLLSTSSSSSSSSSDAPTFRHFPATWRAWKNLLSDIRQDGWAKNDLCPCEFLIDERGIIVDAFRAEGITDSMDMERVEYFMLRGERLVDNPTLKHNQQKKKWNQPRHERKSEAHVHDKKFVTNPLDDRLSA